MRPDDFLIHTTIRIEVQLKEGMATGTGFFYQFFHEEEKTVPAIITNKHVIKDGIRGVLNFSICDEKGELIENDKYTVNIDDFENKWILHPDPNVDLCMLPIAPILIEAIEKNKRLYISTLTKENLLKEDEIKEVSKLEDVTIVGYPDGIWDSYNNLPICRKGIMATPIQYNFMNESKFLIDAAIYGGSSGSPVFIFNQGSYNFGNNMYIGNRVKLVGIVYAVAQHMVSGDLKIVDVPTLKKPIPVTKIPNNLGVVIKAKELLVFENVIKTISGE